MKRTVLFLMALIMSAGFVFSQTVLPASKNVPGVTISSTANGDQWSGANIILGNDETVWPWSTAGDDGAVAFTPVEGATYHLTFTATSTGVAGFRVRWITGNAYDGWTAQDALVVSDSVPWNVPFTADQIPTIVPCYFQGTIANGETKTYSVDFTMDGSQPAGGLVGNLAIRGQQGNHAFIINTIVITDDEGNMLVNYDKDAVIVLPPSKNVPGVTISSTANGDEWSGANIILGNDETVWPWSTAGDDGAVAFTPVQNATYHLTFNATSTGVAGFRVRWITGNAYDGWTAQDALVVSDSVPWNVPFTADQIPTIVPCYFQGTIANGETKTYSVDFTMDGSQPAGGLVGNLAIRGQQGNHAFIINTIVITDDEGNMLVNYANDLHVGIIQVKSDNISQVYNIDGGIIVNANNERVAIYAIDGRLVKQFIANPNINIPLQQGLYIVKVGANKAVKVVVK